MTDCVFCKIANHTEPAWIVYEDDTVIAFLDRRQIRPGHTMVIPKQHIDHFADVPDDLAAHIAIVGNKIARQMYKTLAPQRVGVVVSGYGVAHAHYHVIPLYHPHDITSQQYAFLEDGQIAYGMAHLPVRTPDENETTLALIKL